MKIALACNSLLLTKTLEIFLKKNLTSYKKCDFVISDKNIEMEKPLFVISGEKADLQVPFSESSLMIELDRFYAKLTSKKSPKDEKIETIKEKIDILTKKFRDDLLEVIGEHYEQR
jgi:hypothetical protein